MSRSRARVSSCAGTVGPFRRCRGDRDPVGDRVRDHSRDLLVPRIVPQLLDRQRDRERRRRPVLRHRTDAHVLHASGTGRGRSRSCRSCRSCGSSDRRLTFARRRSRSGDHRTGQSRIALRGAVRRDQGRDTVSGHARGERQALRRAVSVGRAVGVETLGHGFVRLHVIDMSRTDGTWKSGWSPPGRPISRGGLRQAFCFRAATPL